jgi:thiamine-monophosphate kinase
MAKKEKKTELSELGEFRLIEHLTSGIRISNGTSLKGIGDDAAVITCGKELQVLTTDLLVEGIHFNLVYTPLKHLGSAGRTV